jgi:hypothetical protein
MDKFELKVTMLWDVVSCSLVDKCHFLRGTYFAALSGSLLWWWMQQVHLKHWYVSTATWCCTSEDTDLHSHCCKNCTFLFHSDFISSCILFAVQKWYTCHCVTDELHCNSLCLFILDGNLIAISGVMKLMLTVFLYVWGSVHHEIYVNNCPTRCTHTHTHTTIYSLFIFVNCSTSFEW